MKIGRTDKRGFVVKVNRVRGVRGRRVRSRNVHGLTGFDKGRKHELCPGDRNRGRHVHHAHTVGSKDTYVQYIFFAPRTLTP